MGYYKGSTMHMSMSLTIIMVSAIFLISSSNKMAATVTAQTFSGSVCAATSGNSSTCCSTNTCRRVSCSPLVFPLVGTSGVLTLQNLSATTASKCDGIDHNNTEKVVALSTGWYNGGSRCGDRITIIGLVGRITQATVVDECDSTQGCVSQNGTVGQPPCGNNVVSATPAVWAALGVSPNDPRYGNMRILWKH